MRLTNQYCITIVTVVALLLCTFLINQGYDGPIKSAFLAVIAFFFGWQVPSPNQDGQNQYNNSAPGPAANTQEVAPPVRS